MNYQIRGLDYEGCAENIPRHEELRKDFSSKDAAQKAIDKHQPNERTKLVVVEKR